jgi:hypothetical protein
LYFPHNTLVTINLIEPPFWPLFRWGKYYPVRGNPYLRKRAAGGLDKSPPAALDLPARFVNLVGV